MSMFSALELGNLPGARTVHAPGPVSILSPGIHKQFSNSKTQYTMRASLFYYILFKKLKRGIKLDKNSA